MADNLTPPVKVMADYDCFPLWRTGPDGTENLDPQSLPITDGLARRLTTWAAAYDRTLNRADPVSSGFPDEKAERVFNREGEALAVLLARELPGQQVTYFDGRSGVTRPVQA